MKNSSPVLLALVGPTAVGKTAVAVEIARFLDTVVISADSRQFYQEMSIGTAKPTLKEQNGVTHYFVDSHSVEDNLSAGDFERQGLALLKDLFAAYPVVVLTGGSGLFVDALCRGLDDLPSPLPGVREKWNRFYADHGITALGAELHKVDPVYHATVDLHNSQRLIRALEVFESTGKPFSFFRQGKLTDRPFTTVSIGLELPREILYERINQRVDAMMKAGLLNEVRALSKFRRLPALKTVGYAELFQYLDGQLTLEAAVDKIKQNTRRYAKRQLTWFKRNPETAWFRPNDLPGILDYFRRKIGYDESR